MKFLNTILLVVLTFSSCMSQEEKEKAAALEVAENFFNAMKAKDYELAKTMASDYEDYYYDDYYLIENVKDKIIPYCVNKKYCPELASDINFKVLKYELFAYKRGEETLANIHKIWYPCSENTGSVMFLVKHKSQDKYVVGTYGLTGCSKIENFIP